MRCSAVSATVFKTGRFLAVVVALRVVLVCVRNFQHRPITIASPTVTGRVWNTSLAPSFEEQLNYLTKANGTLDRVKVFLESYDTYCRGLLANRSREGHLPWCDCVPEGLVGRQKIPTVLPKKPILKALEKAHPEMVDGHWKPPHCTPRQNIAIILPYRAREVHLVLFLNYMIPFLQRQLVEFTIFVAEQGQPKVFNKASLMNAGFMEVNKKAFDCYFFHDIDTMPEDDRNIYTCTENPRHLGYYVSRRKYPTFIGGGVAFTAEQFQRTNGVSNKFYGWGGEDDDMYYRIVHAGMQVTRFPVSVARYTVLSHVRDPGNPNNGQKTMLVAQTRRDTKKSYLKDGLNTLKYTVKRTEHHPLFTMILIDLPPPPKTYTFDKNGHRQ